MVCRKSYRTEWDELILKAKDEGITPYNLGKELFQDEYRKIYSKKLPICRCLYEDLQEAYNKLSEHSLLKELQTDNEYATTETNIESVRHNQVDGEIGFEIKPFNLIEESESDDMKKFKKRDTGYSFQQYQILDMVNEGKSEEQIKKELGLKGPQLYHAVRMMADENEKGIEFEPAENRPVDNTKKVGKLLSTEIKLPVRIINDGKERAESLNKFVELLNQGKTIKEIHYELSLPYGAISKFMNYIESVPENNEPKIGTFKLSDDSEETKTDNETELNKEIEETEQFSETLKEEVSNAVEQVESMEWNIDDWYAPIMVEPPTDKPIPAPVKQCTPLFEWLDNNWICIGETCYKLNVKFSIMDGDKHAKNGTSIFVESVENGSSRPYMMSVPQFLRFTESRYKYWIDMTIERRYYDAHKARMKLEDNE